MNKNRLSIESGVPYSTIDNFYKIGFQNTKLSTLKKLALYFGVSLDYLVGDDSKLNPNESEAEVTLLGYFNKMNDRGQETVIDIVRGLAASHEYKKDNMFGSMEKEA